VWFSRRLSPPLSPRSLGTRTPFLLLSRPCTQSSLSRSFPDFLCVLDRPFPLRETLCLPSPERKTTTPPKSPLASERGTCHGDALAHSGRTTLRAGSACFRPPRDQFHSKVKSFFFFLFPAGDFPIYSDPVAIYSAFPRIFFFRPFAPPLFEHGINTPPLFLISLVIT